MSLSTVSQELLDRIHGRESNKAALLKVLSEIDADKRSIKSRLNKISRGHDEGVFDDCERQVQICRLNAKIDFLNSEKELVRLKIGEMQINTKFINRSSSSRTVEFGHLFIAAAERLLTKDQFLDIEIKATEMSRSIK